MSSDGERRTSLASSRPDAHGPRLVPGPARPARLAERAASVEGAPARPARTSWRSADPLRRRLLATADVATALLVGVSLALSGAGDRALLAAVAFAPVWLLGAKLYGLYDRDHRSLRHLTVDELGTLAVWATTCLAALVLFCSLTSLAAVSAAGAVEALAVAIVAAVALRGLARSLWRALTPRERVAIVGDELLARSVRRKLDLFPDVHADVVAEHAELAPALARDGRGFGRDVDRIVLAERASDERQLAELVALCRQEHVKLSVVPHARGPLGTAAQLHHVADLPVVEFNTWDVSRSTLMLKRSLDVLVAALMLLATAPLVALIAAAIRLSGSGSALYVQTRVGLGGREFRMFKLRTMRLDAEAALPALVRLDALDEPVFKLRHDPRVTRLGRLLRRTSLDELPQFLNVLKGDMSLVGPRPEQIELVRRYRPEHRIRLEVKPGLTGPMQVFGRGRLTLEERISVEREYIENLSIGRDLRILALTIPSVVAGHGAY